VECHDDLPHAVVNVSALGEYAHKKLVELAEREAVHLVDELEAVDREVEIRCENSEQLIECLLLLDVYLKLFDRFKRCSTSFACFFWVSSDWMSSLFVKIVLGSAAAKISSKKLSSFPNSILSYSLSFSYF
jgi:hypothetical protein